jgi:hypothetical protein
MEIATPYIIENCRRTNWNPPDQAIPGVDQLLGYVSGINLKTQAYTTLATCPTGYMILPTGVLIKAESIVSLTTTPTVSLSIGNGSAVCVSPWLLSGLDATGEFKTYVPTGAIRPATAAELIKLYVDTVAVGTTYTAGVWLFGKVLEV